MNQQQKQTELEKAAEGHANKKACPVIRSMYPSKSRGQMAEEFKESFLAGHAYAISHPVPGDEEYVVCPACGEEYSLDGARMMAHDVRTYEAEIQRLREILHTIEQWHTNWINGARADVVYEEMLKALQKGKQE